MTTWHYKFACEEYTYLCGKQTLLTWKYMPFLCISNFVMKKKIWWSSSNCKFLTYLVSKSHDNLTLQNFMWEIHILMWKADITYLKILDCYIENVLWVTCCMTLRMVYNTSVPGTQKYVAHSFLPQYHVRAPTRMQVPRAHVKFCMYQIIFSP